MLDRIASIFMVLYWCIHIQFLSILEMLLTANIRLDAMLFNYVLNLYAKKLVDRSPQVYIYCHLMQNITDKLISPIQVLNLLNASHLVILAR